MKSRISVLLVAWSVVCSCISVPKPRQIQDTWVIDKGFSEVWDAALVTLAEMRLSVARPADKGGGVISTVLSAFADDKKDCWECKKLSWCQNDKGHRGKISVLLKSVNDSQTEVKVISQFEIMYSDDQYERLAKPFLHYDITIFNRPCISTGKLEADFYKALAAKLKI